MYTRSTPQRNQGGQGNQNYQGQQGYNQQGNYQGGQNQQAGYKQQQGANTPYKQQPQQQQTPQRNPQQVKQQQQQQTPQQQQQPQQVKQQQQQQQQQQQNTPQPQRLKPILKSSANVQGPQTNQGQIQGQNFNQNQQNQPQQQQQQQQQQKQQQLVEQQASNNGMDTAEPQNDGTDSEVQDVPKWRRKTPGLKVNRKLKRLRLNQRLRKTLQPKNAIMVLNEMKTGVQFTFPETQSTLPNALFLVHAEIEGKTYVGQGLSKPLARQNAAENALKSLLLEKMTAAAMKARLDAETEGAANAGSVADGSENKDGENNSMETNTEEPDEIPWSSLASFALYKLFLEWQNQGTVVPVPRPGVSPGKVKKESNKIVVQKELPPNATTIHPVMLLNQMRPGLTYTEVSRAGNPPNTMFTLAVEIEGQEYTGTAKNKKDAKKVAAKAALHALFNLVYPEEKETEDVNMG
jgi:dsRNA-specific ribonuclease